MPSNTEPTPGNYPNGSGRMSLEQAAAVSRGDPRTILGLVTGAPKEAGSTTEPTMEVKDQSGSSQRWSWKRLFPWLKNNEPAQNPQPSALEVTPPTPTEST